METIAHVKCACRAAVAQSVEDWTGEAVQVPVWTNIDVVLVLGEVLGYFHSAA